MSNDLAERAAAGKQLGDERIERVAGGPNIVIGHVSKSLERADISPSSHRRTSALRQSWDEICRFRYGRAGIC